jgi:hypothetical protein
VRIAMLKGTSGKARVSDSEERGFTLEFTKKKG